MGAWHVPGTEFWFGRKDTPGHVGRRLEVVFDQSVDKAAIPDIETHLGQYSLCPVAFIMI